MLLFPNLLGVKLYIAGKFNGNLRARNTQLIFRRNIPLQRLVKKITYAQKNVTTFTGIFGIHLWFYYD
jgi:ribosomal protein S3